MNCKQAIQEAKWILAKGESGSPVIEKKFICHDPSKGRIALTSLGYFMLYLNGRRVGEDYFLPANSNFHKRDKMTLEFPIEDHFVYRCYYTVYDLSPYLKEGENTLEIALGSGQYRQTIRIPEGRMNFGLDLGARFALEVDGAAILSDGSESFRNSPLVYDQLYRGEVYDARITEFFYRPVTVTELPETLLTPEEHAPDRIERRIVPRLLHKSRVGRIYDVGENISGFVSVRVTAQRGYEIRIRFAEERKSDGKLDFFSAGNDRQIQEDVYISDGTEAIWEPRFVWHGFRYFEVLGDAEAIDVAVVHNDTPRCAEFTSSSEELNWLFETYLRTQLNNMHGGIPSDCPHRERLGYTGDGQLCAPAAMMLLDTKEFYRKWIRDIFDSQNPRTGHVPHTAPFAGGGGGPGGWGGAAVYVPYYFYKAFGEKEILSEYYERIKMWIGYLCDHSEDGVVVREEPNGWCLGDWCTLEKTVIPEPFVNTCLMYEMLDYVKKIARAIGREEDLPELDCIQTKAREGLLRRFYNGESGSFCEGIQGADAIALAVGLGDERTLATVCEKYETLGAFDTGIFGTPMLCKVLLESGREDLLYTLLSSHKVGSFGYMMDHGATALWEEWDGKYSHDHPMFGACVQYLISAFLGITQEKGSVGYEVPLIAPKIPRMLASAKGKLKTPKGEIAVAWVQNGKEISFEIDLADALFVDFLFEGERRTLVPGKNTFTVTRK